MRSQVDRVKLAVAVAMSGFLFAGCMKRDDFPDEPSISFKSLIQYGDSASYTISFTDGDGDVGLDPSDNQPPFDTVPYSNNLFLEYEELQNGTWTHINFLLPLHYRIPRITPTGQNKALEGEIAVALKPWHLSDVGDTIRITAYMLDRSLHQSNTVVSGPVVVQ